MIFQSMFQLYEVLYVILGLDFNECNFATRKMIDFSPFNFEYRFLAIHYSQEKKGGGG
jgi:hypothetical protein